ncbi:MAG: tagatose 1,6-diphosphate aldolase [Ktedonobacteraceae bacterium]
MTKIEMSRGKFAGINACADERGVIAALAVDHRGNLLQSIAEARGAHGTASSEDMLAFKSAVTRILTRHTSAILLDPEYGLGAIASRAPGTGVLLAYERSGYDFAIKGRLPDLLPEWSVQRLIEAGANAIKILLFYNPFDEARINNIKQAYVERIGAECLARDVPFFLEPLVYNDTLGDEKGLAFARKKPLYVARTMQEFSRPRYGVDILKVELPVNPAFVGGTQAYAGEEVAYSRQEAIEHFHATANATSLPFIYLSGGSKNDVFCEMLELAVEANVRFAGVLCGRATWQDAIPVYAREGVEALSHWLEERGSQNIQALHAILAQSATPWWETGR